MKLLAVWIVTLVLIVPGPHGVASAASEGHVWTAVGSDPTGALGALDGTVEALAVLDGDLYVGGSFENAGGIPQADYLARWDGHEWHAVGSNPAGTDGALSHRVYALLVSGSDLYVGGAFRDAGGIRSADRLARWDGSDWHAVGSGPSGDGAINMPVTSLAMWRSDLYVGGRFDDVAGIDTAARIARWDGDAWHALGSSPRGSPAIPGGSAVSALAVYQDGLYVGGSLADTAGVWQADNIARWDGSAWHALPGAVDDMTGPLEDSILALAVVGADLYVGGSFRNAVGIPQADGVVRFDGEGWHALGSDPTGTDGAITSPSGVMSLVVYEADLYVGGRFQEHGGIPGARAVARWDGDRWHTVPNAPDVESNGFNRILSMAVVGPDLYLGGRFWAGMGIPQASHLIRYGPSRPEVALMPPATDFGIVDPDEGLSPSKDVKLANTGTAPLSVASVELVGPDADRFVITLDQCSGATVGAAKACRISIGFDPTGLGPAEARLRVTTDAASSPDTASLTGRGGLLAPSSGASTITAGALHSCARMQGGTVRCWGDDSFGQLGTGGLAPAGTVGASAQSPAGVVGLGDISEVVAGDDHTCALRKAGTVVCWGRNDHGQLGDGTFQSSAFPVSVSGLSQATGITAGGRHTCAYRADGTVRCWGDNRSGQLGDGTRQTRAVPVRVRMQPRVVALAAGDKHTCALRNNGQVRCWGANGSGQLGDGTRTSRRSPVVVVGLSGVRALGAGGHHTCVSRGANGRVHCWGRNADGQLGNGTRSRRVRHVALTLRGVTDIDGGSAHTCARRMNGTLHCWGRNADGQVGDATTSRRTRPVRVRGINSARRVTAGSAHSCARRSGGEIVCWGRNDAGQLGDGSARRSLVPVAVGSAGVPRLGGGSLDEAELDVPVEGTPTPHPTAEAQPEPTPELVPTPSPVPAPTSTPPATPDPTPAPTARPAPEAGPKDGPGQSASTEEDAADGSTDQGLVESPGQTPGPESTA